MNDVKQLYIKEPHKRKDKMDRYNLKEGKVKSSYAREYINDKKPKKIELVYKPPTEYQMIQENVILNDAWIVNLMRSEDGKPETKQSDNEIQPRESVRDIMAMQDIPRRKASRKRKTTDTKKSNNELQP